MFDGREKRSAGLFSTRKAHEGGGGGGRGKSASQNAAFESLTLNYAGFEVLLDETGAAHPPILGQKANKSETNLNSWDNKRLFLILNGDIRDQKELNTTSR